MSDLNEAPEPYRVSYSGRVRDARAHRKGLWSEFAAALAAIDHRLHIYPQFGQPLRDLSIKPAQLWIATVAPLVIKYLLDEERRLVLVAKPIVALPGSGL